MLKEDREKTHKGIKEVVKPFDWSYTSDYKGTIKAGKSFTPTTTEHIPIELLKRPDPILFFEEVVLYESELDDNGISIYSCKVRVMPERMLLLCRNFMRLDNVTVRIRDTRIYVEFDTGKVIRDYSEREDEFEKVKKVSVSESTKESVLMMHLESPILRKATRGSYRSHEGSEPACSFAARSHAYVRMPLSALKGITLCTGHSDGVWKHIWRLQRAGPLLLLYYIAEITWNTRDPAAWTLIDTWNLAPCCYFHQTGDSLQSFTVLSTTWDLVTGSSPPAVTGSFLASSIIFLMMTGGVYAHCSWWRH